MQIQHLPSQKPSSLAEATDASAQSAALTNEEPAATLLPSEEVASVEVCGKALSQEARRMRRNVLRGTVGLSIFGALMIVAKSVADGEAWERFMPAQILVSGTLSLLLIFFLFVGNSARKPRQRRRELTARVAEQYDVRSVGPLIDALSLSDRKTHDLAMDALCEWLPRLQATDDALLTTSQRAKLCYLLGLQVENPLHKDVRALFQPADPRGIDFRVAILQAFEQVGDSNAIPIVTHLATRTPGTAGESHIHEAATACLAALRLRQEQVRSCQTLLRASQASVAGSDTLLRPVEGSQETAPAELLRASSSQS